MSGWWGTGRISRGMPSFRGMMAAVLEDRTKKVIIIDSDRRGLLIRPVRIARSLSTNGYEVEILEWDRAGEKPKTEHIEGYEVHNFRFRQQFITT